jgi:nickel-dependent lactate racemase
VRQASFAERALANVPRSLFIERSPQPVTHGEPVLALCQRALAEPVSASPLGELAAGAKRIAICVSDATRDEPRAEMLEALLEIVPENRVTLVVAHGTHAPVPPTDAVIPRAFCDLPRVIHDGRREADLVDLGSTTRGTRVRIQRAVAEADLVICTGRVRPHYFAGWSGGVKSVFPGCAHADDILHNHRLKTDPSARLGRTDDNVCRLDMEEAAARVPGRLFMLSVLCDIDGNPVAAAAGDPIRAHRTLGERAHALFTVRAPRSRVVCVADRPPVTSSLYQASKLAPPAGAILEPGGSVIVIADCSEGTGPLERVNLGIYEIGIRPQLPTEHRIFLHSTLDPSTVAQTYATPASDLCATMEAELRRTGAERAVLLWRAGECLAVADET